MRKRLFFLLAPAAVLVLLFPFQILAEEDSEEQFTATVKSYPYRFPDLTVIGSPTWFHVPPKDTLLDIARRFGLGFNEVDLLYPRMDKWLPPNGKKIAVPTFWVLPPTNHQQLVINVPELRIYFFLRNSSTVQTYPIGIGDEGWETPLGTFHITEKRTNPSWYVPLSLQEKYGMAVMPPGPENPLGDYMMKFSAGAYGVHGTAMPWGVGRLVSHGCIRCYPEHIKILFPQVPIGTKLEIIYEPVKLGRVDSQIYVEAHPDVYRKIPDYTDYAVRKLDEHPQAAQVDRKRFLMAIRLQNGVPTNVSRIVSEDISVKMVELGQ
ncbi:MAG TPA: L,D-transpeptidase family protein [Syntrophobacteraceae bacterium]|nr:L,D-transpeptidase family protein [Syntrophobacteraceae bacterium]